MSRIRHELEKRANQRIKDHIIEVDYEHTHLIHKLLDFIVLAVEDSKEEVVICTRGTRASSGYIFEVYPENFQAALTFLNLDEGLPVEVLPHAPHTAFINLKGLKNG